MITIAICTYNPNPERLERTLQGIERQAVTAGDTDFFIVDNRSIVPVKNLEPVRRRRIRVVREDEPGLTAARLRAASEACGDIVVFADDDTVLAEDYVQQVAGLMCDSSIAMVSGSIKPEYETPPPRWLRRFEANLVVRSLRVDETYLVDRPVHSRYFPVGAGCAVRRDTLLEHARSLRDAPRIEGRCGSELSGGEDIDIALFALASGKRVGVSGRLRAIHLIPQERTSPDYVRRLLIGDLRSLVALERKWRPVTGAPVFPFLYAKRSHVLLKAALFTALSWWPSFRVRAAVQWELGRLRSGLASASHPPAPAFIASS